VGRRNIHLSLSYPAAWGLVFLMDIFARLIRRPPLFSWTALEFLTQKCRFDISKAKEKLGYKPSVSLKEGMEKIQLQRQA